MKVIISGDLNYLNYNLLEKTCDFMLSKISNIEIINGGENGADYLGRKYAKKRGYTYEEFPADWSKYGKGAGYKRNCELINKADCIIVFWNGRDKHIKHMINTSNKKRLQTKIVKYG